MRDACYPGWAARIDGVETPIECADSLFRKIAVPSGRHQIEFSYEPQSVRIGAIVSLVGLLLWLALVAVVGAPSIMPACQKQR
ncbi:MAG: YfhO family protein [Anaerolineae bacterium]|nr:YfhO family protein [Anaerolineae bacterium]